ncbi:oxidoreductase ptaK, partial [Pseudocercospora fuligena]
FVASSVLAWEERAVGRTPDNVRAEQAPSIASGQSSSAPNAASSQSQISSTKPIAQYIEHALTTSTANTTEAVPPVFTKTEIVQATVDVTITASSSCQVPKPTQNPTQSWSTTSASTAWSAQPTKHGPGSSCQLPSNTLSNSQQVGNSTWGTLCQPTFPKWLPQPDGTEYKTAPWGDKTSKLFDASNNDDIPVTNVTRKYDFTVSRGVISADGVKRDVILVNNQFPGPAIEANWGDSIEITVHNNINSPLEGTAIHWHGFLQRGTNWMDGVPGISQCPIAPGSSYTYTIPAQLYGTSWYHAHYSAQYTGGVLGPIIVYGPSQQDYDIDIGPVMLSDWYHVPYFSIVSDAVGSDLSEIPPAADSMLINGRGRFNCSNPSYGDDAEWLASGVSSQTKWSCTDNAELSKFEFQPGKVHRLRLMNTGADGVQKFTIDGHKMQVIAYDYVPVTPYTTEVITLGVGQRADVLVTADNTSTNKFWIRSRTLSGPQCGGSASGEAHAAIFYSGSDTSSDPTTQASLTFVNDTSCNNVALDTTFPEFIIPAPDLTKPETYKQLDILMTLELNATGHYEWRMNNQTFKANFNEPALYPVAETGNISSTFSQDPFANVYDTGDAGYVVLNLTNRTPLSHPFHLHGHNIQILSQGQTALSTWDGTIEGAENPMRRDIQIIPALGYLVVAFQADNPGIWPFHCHVAWHLSGGLAVNLITRKDEIPKIPEGERQKTCEAWDQYSRTNVVDQIDAGS